MSDLSDAERRELAALRRKQGPHRGWVVWLVWIVWALFYLWIACTEVLKGDVFGSVASCALVVFWCAYGEFERRRYHRLMGQRR